MPTEIRRAMVSASLLLTFGLGSTCPNEDGPPAQPEATEPCGNATDCTTSSSSSSTTDSESSSSSSSTTDSESSSGESGSSESSGDTDVDDDTIVEIVAGNSHTCVLFANGAVRCWGHVYWNGLAVNEAVGDDEHPAELPDVDIGGIAIDIEAGTHVCVVLDTGGVRCWGENDDGQLGHGLGPFELIGDDEAPSSIPEIWFNPRAADPLHDPPPADAPHAVAVSAGERGTCVLLDDERVWCWGAGSVVGETTGDDEHASVAVPHDFTVGIAQASLAGNHACVRTSNDTARCWGSSGYGALGYGSGSAVSNPVLASDVNVGASVLEIVHGAVTTCAVTDMPDLRCWGVNGNGMLGLGHTDHIGDDEAPVFGGPSAIGGEPRDVCSAPTHMCAVLDDGTVRCWGDNTPGQLGYGHFDRIGDDELPSSEPAIDFSREATMIACDGAHTCVVLEDDAVRCWGMNGAGQLGLGHTNTVIDADDPSVPDVQVR